MKNLDLSIVILNYNTKDLVVSCVESIFKFTKDLSFEILLVDNGSSETNPERFKNIIKKHEQVKLVTSSKNLGFSAGNNLAMKKARGRYILLLNSDTYLTQKVLEPLILWLDANLKIGIATCELKNKNNSHQASGGAFPNIFNAAAWMFFLDDIPLLSRLIKSIHPKHAPSKPTQQDWITGAFFLIRSKVISQIGYLNTDFFMYVEDMEYCFRAKMANWQVWYLPQWSIVHLGGSSSTGEFSIISELKNQLLFYKKYYPPWQYSLYHLVFRLGILLRIAVFTILKGKEEGLAYVKAFQQI